MFTPSILIVDDEPLVRESLKEIIAAEGYKVWAASAAEEALPVIEKERIDIVLLDMILPGMGGLELLRHLKEGNYHGEVIIMTAYSTVESALAAIKSGAYDYLIKPCNNEDVKLLLRRIIEHNRLQIENRILRRRLHEEHGLSSIIGGDYSMRKVFELILAAAPGETTVLITGETGTGKEMAARAIHHAGPRKDKPFVKIDCASLASDILESELFGHEKGAFTNAMTQREGRVETACGGTLFLDEIGCLPLELQAKLLRLIQEKEFERIGSNKTIKVDIRIIAATNLELEHSVKGGKFRNDLYYRLNVLHIKLPALRERKKDIPLLLHHFVEVYNKKIGKKIKGFSPESLRLLTSHCWPGNVRELKNYVERAVLLEKSDYITTASLPEMFRKGEEDPLGPPRSTGSDFRKQVSQYEKRLLESALEECRGKKKEAARLLGLSPRLFSYYFKKYLHGNGGEK